MSIKRILSVICVLLFLAGCHNDSGGSREAEPPVYEEVKLGEAYSDAFKGITKIRIMSGHGKELFIDDQATINDIIEKFKELVVKQLPPPKEDSTGYSYSLSFYRGDDKSVVVTTYGSRTVTIERIDYEVVTRTWMDEIEKMIESLYD